MNSSLSFDRAAGFYDQTRPLFEPAARMGIQAILDLTGPSSRILDVGTGTGRISIPLLERGANLIGCDISTGMLKRLKAKYPSAPLSQADAAHLPFPKSNFEAVLTVHVIHLIAPWQQALREFQRVLVPGGLYLNIRTYATVGNSIREQVRTFWREWVEAQGISINQPGVRDYQVFLQELRTLGAELAEQEVVRYALAFTLGEELDRFVSRTYSDAWDVPEAIHAASIKELHSWVAQEFGDLDQTYEDEVRFVIDTAKFKNQR